MWLFTRYGFYSVSSVNATTVAVRARDRAHLIALVTRFGGANDALRRAKVVSLPGRDYPYRFQVPKAVWAKVVNEMVMEQTWSNFKDEARRFRGQPGYLRALHDVWFRMATFGDHCRDGRNWIGNLFSPRRGKKELV